LPLRHPALVAKDIATIEVLSGGRLILGIGSGWNPHAFQAAGVILAERGSRMDEAIEVIRRLLRESTVTHHGKHYRFTSVSLTPRPAVPPPMWVAGGSEPGRGIAPSVLDRIVRADGWIARARGSNAMAKADWQEIVTHCRAMRRNPSGLTFAHINFLHVVATNDREKALDSQRERFVKTMGTRRPWAQIQESHLTGTPEDIVDRLADLSAAGLTHMILSPLDYDIEQLELYASEIVTRFHSRPAQNGGRH
jgi:alkanesulfonate monooxygenase SsuD/methylene tetrahydromethanopterin reductase-like flavin-dependent oxidoreductase (luciferase family)